MEQDHILNNLSEHLFWDVDKNNIDKDKHQEFIIKKVLQYGLFNDWLELLKIYGLQEIINTSKGIRDLDKKTLSFLSLIGEVSKKEFLCYNTKQSIPKHWNF